MMTELYALLADAVLLLHAAFVAFVVGGQALILFGWWQGWDWTRNPIFRVTHLAAIGFVVLEAWFGAVCPLTVIENRLRRAAGQSVYELSFIGHWVRELLFYSAPEWVFTIIYTVFALLVIASFALYPPRRNACWKGRSKHGE